jgi:hypothetical protein
VNVKYKTKNNTTDDNCVFLATKNHKKAITSSRRNLRVTATRLCNVWLAGSLSCPLKKMIRVTSATMVRIEESKATSPNPIPVPDFEMMKNPAARIRSSSSKSS